MDIIHQTAKHCERLLFSLLSTDDEKTGIASTIIIEEIGYAFVCNWNGADEKFRGKLGGAIQRWCTHDTRRKEYQQFHESGL